MVSDALARFRVWVLDFRIGVWAPSYGKYQNTGIAQVFGHVEG